MTVYLIENLKEKPTGYLGGVDFYQGRGSTSSGADAKRLASLGYRVSELGASKTKVEGVSAETPSAISRPVVAEEVVPTIFVNKADRERHEGLVRRLEGEAPAKKKGKKK